MSQSSPPPARPSRGRQALTFVLLLAAVVGGFTVAALAPRESDEAPEPQADVTVAPLEATRTAPSPSTTPSAPAETDAVAEGPAYPRWPTLGPSAPGPVVPAPDEAMADQPDHYAETCHQTWDDQAAEACVYGDPESQTTVVLVGDSHAAAWQPAMRSIAESHGWRLEVFTKSACPLADVTVWVRRDDRPYDTCRAWGQAVLPAVLERSPDLVVTTLSGEYDVVVDGAKVDAGPEADAVLVEGLTRTWGALADAGKVLVLADTPWYPAELHTCLEENSQDPSLCDAPREDAMGISGTVFIEEAVAAEPRVSYADLTPAYCGETVCPAVVDGIAVMRDEHHLSATFSRYLAPWLDAAVVHALDAG